jgi:hypothetical protein
LESPRVGLVVLLLVGIGIIYAAWRSATTPVNVPGNGANVSAPTIPPAQDFEGVFSSKVAPLIRDYESKNAKAIWRSLDRINWAAPLWAMIACLRLGRDGL